MEAVSQQKEKVAELQQHSNQLQASLQAARQDGDAVSRRLLPKHEQVQALPHYVVAQSTSFL